MKPTPRTSRILAVFAASLAFLACGGDRETPAPGGETGPVAPPWDGPELFRETTAGLGLDWRHTVDRRGDFALPEIMGAGAALFDADGDGDDDLYLVDGGRWPKPGGANRLYLRGDDGRFTDATATSGLGDTGYGFGVAAADIDNDGDVDVYVANDGPDALYRNRGDGTFDDVTAAAGILGVGWSTSVAFLDFDLDGYLDIFVVRYVAFDPTTACSLADGRRDYCSPKAFPGVADTLFRNRGDGTFEDVSVRAGITRTPSNGLGLIIDDFDGNGRPDVYVANDGEPNHLWINAGGGVFENQAVLVGVAVNGQGAPEASMGVAAGDVDGEGSPDLFMTHLVDETNTLFVSEGVHGWVDASERSGVARASRGYTGFGTVMLDVENDGDLDIALVNGRVGQGTPFGRAKLDALWNRYAEPNQLLLNDGKGSFTDASAATGTFFSTLEVSRGLLAADLDGDGGLDLIVTNCGGPVRAYRNTAPDRGRWLAIRAVDAALKRDAVGARVTVTAGARSWHRRIGAAGSYLCSGPTAVHVGLGDVERIDGITVEWPGHGAEEFGPVPLDRAIVLRRGEGR